MHEPQPIATAPRDGTPILAFGCWTESAPRDIWHWWVVGWKQYTVERLEDVGNGLFRKVTELGGGWGAEPACFKPTHWVPLPAPPPEEAV